MKLRLKLISRLQKPLGFLLGLGWRRKGIGVTEDEKQRVRALFVCIIRMLKSESEINGKICSELASVLGAVNGLDPTFRDVLEHRRAEVKEISDQIIRADLAEYDEMIQRVESGEFL
jgi:hypothetical protein